MKKIAYILTALMLLLCTAAQAQKKYSFKGKLGSGISFRLDLEQNKDGIVAGETTYYRKNGKTAKVPVYGWRKSPEQHGLVTWNEDVLMLTEFDGTEECGYFWVNLKKDEAVGGGWHYTGKEYEMNSIKKTTFPKGKTYFHPAKGSAMNGEYRFDFKPDSGRDDHGGSCTLTYKKGGKVHYRLCVINPNIAEEEKTGTLNGSYFTGAHDNYQYKGYVDRNFVCIWATNDGSTDDWGAWTTIGGFYVKKK